MTDIVNDTVENNTQVTNVVENNLSASPQDVTPNESLLPQKELILGKFKTNEDVYKAYEEAQKQISKYGQNGAPKDGYKFDKQYADPKFADTLANTMKELNISQDAAIKLLDGVFTYKQVAEQQAIAKQQAIQTQELSKLGENATERISNLNSWVKSNFNETEQQMIKSFCTNAEAVKLVEGLKGRLEELNRYSQPPSDLNNPFSPQTSRLKELQKMVANKETSDWALKQMKQEGFL